jgi:hypothetical protein
MNWDLADPTGDDIAWLEFMTNLKFDHYQGYTPGERFYVHLVHWLSQFNDAERQIAFEELVRSRLIFVSQREMQHLVSLSYPIIQRQIRARNAAKTGLKLHQIWGDPATLRAIRLEELRTLYVALSDGARIDFFRRENEGIISNEQVVPSSEITEAKWKDLKKELIKSLAAHGFADESPSFERICLIDDFTASGSTFARCEKGEWKGKLHKFCNPTKEVVPAGFIANGATVQVHHYLGSARAAAAIRESVDSYAPQAEMFKFEVTFAHLLRSEDMINDDSKPPELVQLIREHYDDTLEKKNSHLGTDVWYGYKKGGLCVVLDHNTPNNSIALLWAQQDHPELMRPLFPRKQRHIDHG